MTIYNDILKSLDEPKSLSKHMNSLVKFFSKSEDPKLKEAIELCIRELHQFNSLSKSKATPVRVTKSAEDSGLARFVNQIERAAKIGKPEWQVMAIRAKWTPPNA